MTSADEKKRQASLNKGLMDCKRIAHEGKCTAYLVKTSRTSYEVSLTPPPAVQDLVFWSNKGD